MRLAPLCMLALAGCPPTNPRETGEENPCYAEDPVLVVGTGEAAWEDLDEGDSLVMVHGPQGGWHMLGSARLLHTNPVVTIHYTVTHVASGVVVADNRYTVQLYPDGECAGYFPGMYAYLDVSDLAEGELDTPPELLAYEQMRIDMSAIDRDDRTASASLVVIAEPDPADMP